MIQSVEIFSLKGTRVGKLCINSYVEMRLFQLRWVTMDARDFQNLTHTAQNQVQLILIKFFLLLSFSFYNTQRKLIAFQIDLIFLIFWKIEESNLQILFYWGQ